MHQPGCVGRRNDEDFNSLVYSGIRRLGERERLSLSLLRTTSTMGACTEFERRIAELIGVKALRAVTSGNGGHLDGIVGCWN